MEENWIYANTLDNKARFLLGEKGGKTLVCIGINPSTAVPNKLDNTLTTVKNRAAKYGYNSWVMLNIYPQRATYPNNLHRSMDLSLHRQNIKQIKKFVGNNFYDVWAAWGASIEKRNYLLTCLNEIYQIMKEQSNWFSVGSKTIAGHPHHPLYLKKDLAMEKFDIQSYLKEKLENRNE